ncbi:DoxX family membrane protein [Flavobacterium rakeshii]|uniref:DoxX family membrane protein n=1 Tax=Flavobacterium rakeshii TaxID=1038845 RepID=A0A6N8HE53_9FLAO|nr:DoxX family protein [Flavobacterium rakeshii]MUV02987.1 DoxX family membrane protein [Flavobacterium rakeshii]
MKTFWQNNNRNWDITSLGLLFFRIAVSIELILVHGLKKLGVGVSTAEVVPNPLHLPEALNQVFATTANVILPLFVIFGIVTRLAVVPILAVTLTGYFVVHGGSPLPERDIPFMYSISFLLLFITGPGKYSIDSLLFKKTSV